MKRVRCPKCDNYLTFDEKRYEHGQSLVFACPNCKKEFKIRLGAAPKQEERTVCGYVVVIENVFHFRQELPLYEGDNVLGRYVKGTNNNTPIETVDPSVDTTHCVIHVQKKKNGAWQFALRDAGSNTGTFCQTELLRPAERRVLEDGNILTIGATTLLIRTSSIPNAADE